ncbi:POLA2, partial [Symbiodinium sp. KB8]
DFSRVAQKAGHQGDRGRLFEDELRAALKSHRFAFLYENVEMNAEAAKVSSDALGVQPVFVCPSDLRPRLWWLSVDWTRLASDPTNRSPLEWAKKGRRLAAVRASADSFDLGGLEFHSSVAQGRKLMPCATTPAPTDSRRRRPVAGEVAARPRDQEHTRALLDELVAETRLGRVMGPCAAPDHWSVPTVALPSVADMGVLRQPPPGDCFAALSFAICQVDENGELKLRRGEDWRRSGHNATMGASDVPTHHFLGDIVDLVLRAGVWPRPPERLSPVGGSPPRALRCSCALLLVLLGHFVDDFNGVDSADLADSAHHAAQAPAKRHVVQGVELSIRPEGVELAPRPSGLSPGRSPDAADTVANSDDTLSLRRLVASHRPRLVPWPGRVTGPFPVLYADAFFLDGDLKKKPGHLAAGEAVPKAARWQNSPSPAPGRPRLLRLLQFALMKGYGKDPSVNGILASFWGLASDRQWAPDFHRVPSESNVSDAISRGDDSRARAEGWTRVATPVDDIMDVLGRAAADIDFACHSAP